MIWQTAAMTEPLMSSNKSKFPRNFQNPELHGPSFCKLPPQRHTVSTHPRTDPSVCMSDGFAFQIPSGNSLLPLAHTDALEEGLSDFFHNFFVAFLQFCRFLNFNFCIVVESRVQLKTSTLP
jgi:hypothetical protein